jgi:hypothetical protein
MDSTYYARPAKCNLVSAVAQIYPSDVARQVNVPIFAVLNAVFAGLCLIGILIMGGILTYGVFFLGDPRSEMAADITGSLLILIPLSLAFGVFLSAAIGLFKKSKWGHYLHIAGAVVALFSILGVAYTVLALVFALRPEFIAEFFGDSSNSANVARKVRVLSTSSGPQRRRPLPPLTTRRASDCLSCTFDQSVRTIHG